MLWDASAIKGFAIEASDGRLGTVSDLLFEDVGWVVRWLVVDTGNWLPGRKVSWPMRDSRWATIPTANATDIVPTRFSAASAAVHLAWPTTPGDARPRALPGLARR